MQVVTKQSLIATVAERWRDTHQARRTLGRTRRTAIAGSNLSGSQGVAAPC